MFVTALLLGLVGVFCILDSRILGRMNFERPLITCTIVGALLGDLQTGLTLGASIELMSLGIVNIGAAAPPDMNIKLTLGERLKDLRVERSLKLETLAEQTGLSKSALSKYESDDVTDLSIYAVTTLAEFYGVTTDYLLGVTENKKRPDAVLSDLHLSDGAVDVLRNGNFNHRLLCELLEHPDFSRWMTDLEICVDGLVSDRIRDMNAMVEATRQELEKRYHADAEDLTMRTLKAAQINEDEYFGQILYDELAAILKQIKAAHGTDKTTSDGAAVEQARKQLENAQKFEGSPLEKKMNVLMGQIGIDYSKLTKEEQMTLLRVFNKSSMLKHRTKAGMRGKYRR